VGTGVGVMRMIGGMVRNTGGAVGAGVGGGRMRIGGTVTMTIGGSVGAEVGGVVSKGRIVMIGGMVTTGRTVGAMSTGGADAAGVNGLMRAESASGSEVGARNAGVT
jgi:hypothetical protein